MILNVVSSESLDNFVNFYKIQLSLIEFQKEQLETGIKFLNDLGIVHHDIKPGNIIYLRGRIYLIDLEFVKEYKPGEKEEEIVGTESFIPANLKPYYNPFEKEQFALQKTIEYLCKEVAISAEP